MDKVEINRESFVSKIENVFLAVSNLESIIAKIESKTLDLNKVYIDLHSKNSHSINNSKSFLQFQLQLLNNENNYFRNLKKIINNKLYSEIFELNDNIMMIIFSLELLQVNDTQKKDSIMKRKRSVKRPSILDSHHLKNVVHTILNNLSLIGEFVDLFEEHINYTYKKNKKENNHCNKLIITLRNKKHHIVLEHNKYHDELEEIINYFNDLCTNLLRQIKVSPYQELLINTDVESPEMAGDAQSDGDDSDATVNEEEGAADADGSEQKKMMVI